MLTIWGRADSSNVQALMWAVAELDLPHRRIDAGHRFGVNDTAAFRAMNPNGTVPVIRDADNPPLWETGAILRYLCQRYATAPFWPDDAVARAEVDMWAEWAKLNVAMAFSGPVFWQVVRIPPAERDPAMIARGIERTARALAIAERRLADLPFLCGDALTLADIQFGHMLYRWFDIAIDRPALPALRAYYDRLTERPAYRTHVMVSYEALRAP